MYEDPTQTRAYLYLDALYVLLLPIFQRLKQCYFISICYLNAGVYDKFIYISPTLNGVCYTPTGIITNCYPSFRTQNTSRRSGNIWRPSYHLGVGRLLDRKETRVVRSSPPLMPPLYIYDTYLQIYFGDHSSPPPTVSHGTSTVLYQAHLIDASRLSARWWYSNSPCLWFYFLLSMWFNLTQKPTLGFDFGISEVTEIECDRNPYAEQSSPNDGT